MRLADFTPTKRFELCAFALNIVLQDLEAPIETAAIVDACCRRLETNEAQLVGRTLLKIAPSIPEARRNGETFKRFGKVFERWEWWPKGQTPHGLTRQAKRGAEESAESILSRVWSGKVYASVEDMEAAQQSAGLWEV